MFRSSCFFFSSFPRNFLTPRLVRRKARGAGTVPVRALQPVFQGFPGRHPADSAMLYSRSSWTVGTLATDPYSRRSARRRRGALCLITIYSSSVDRAATRYLPPPLLLPGPSTLFALFTTTDGGGENPAVCRDARPTFRPVTRRRQ